MMSTLRRRPLGFALALSLILAAAEPAAAGAAQGEERLIILGFDGADGRTVEALMAEGRLPNMQRLAERGTFARLETTNPAESPVSWASLHTGQNPGKTGVMGFVRRKEDTTMPTMGHIDTGVERPIEDFSDTPVPTWSAPVFAAVAAAAVFLGFLFLLAVLLRTSLGVAIPLALALAGVGAWAGWKVRGYLPSSVEVVANRLRAAPFWETAAQAGVPSVILAAGQSFDRAPVEGAKVLAGLGIPDANGNVQSFFIYTTDEFYFYRNPEEPRSNTGSGGLKLRLDEQEGRIEGHVYGPHNFWEIDRVKASIAALERELQDPNLNYKESIAVQDEKAALEDELETLEATHVTQPLVVERGADGATATVTLGHESQVLAEGQWSDWYHLTFELNPLVKVQAVTRAKIVKLAAPHFELYVDTLQIDPAAPPFWQPISMPASFASELAGQIGTYETIGWACATMPFKDEVLDPVSFMQEIQFTFETRAQMTLAALERDDWRIFMSTLSTPDRAQHMMYQFYDEEHPLYDAAKAGQTFEYFGETITLRDAIPAHYAQVDRLIGTVLDEHVGENDTLLICSDHGFQSFRRQVHVNNWLHEHGYLALQEGISSKSASLLDLYVDWSKTKAYSLGLGMIYLNKQADGKRGIVAPDEEKPLLLQIRADFLATKDDATGLNMGRDAFLLSEIYSGPYHEADMMLGFDNSYRSSWGSASGGFSVVRDEAGAWQPGPIFEDNDNPGSRNWSGDHTSMAAEVVAGMFFSNRPVAIPEGGVNLLDIAPTALAVMGVPVPAEYDRPALTFRD